MVTSKPPPKKKINKSIYLQVKPPTYQIYNVDDANMVFDQLNECRITGRAVLQVCNTEDDDDLA